MVTELLCFREGARYKVKMPVFFFWWCRPRMDVSLLRPRELRVVVMMIVDDPRALGWFMDACAHRLADIPKGPVCTSNPWSVRLLARIGFTEIIYSRRDLTRLQMTESFPLEATADTGLFRFQRENGDYLLTAHLTTKIHEWYAFRDTCQDPYFHGFSEAFIS
jgi:hypothetical protein